MSVFYENNYTRRHTQSSSICNEASTDQYNSSNSLARELNIARCPYLQPRLLVPNYAKLMWNIAENTFHCRESIILLSNHPPFIQITYSFNKHVLTRRLHPQKSTSSAKCNLCSASNISPQRQTTKLLHQHSLCSSHAPADKLKN